MKCKNRKSKSSRSCRSTNSNSKYNKNNKNYRNSMTSSNRKDFVVLNSSMDLEKWAIGRLRFEH